MRSNTETKQAYTVTFRINGNVVGDAATVTPVMYAAGAQDLAEAMAEQVNTCPLTDHRCSIAVEPTRGGSTGRLPVTVHFDPADDAVDAERIEAWLLATFELLADWS